MEHYSGSKVAAVAFPEFQMRANGAYLGESSQTDKHEDFDR